MKKGPGMEKEKNRGYQLQGLCDEVQGLIALDAKFVSRDDSLVLSSCCAGCAGTSDRSMARQGAGHQARHILGMTARGNQ